MVSTITEITRVSRAEIGKVDYFVLRANAVQGDAKAELLDDGFINPLACVSRSFDLTKCLFPVTMEQADLMEKTYLVGGKVRLGLFQYTPNVKFNILGKDGNFISDKVTKKVKKVNNSGKAEIVNGKIVNVGESYEEEIIEETPRVFSSISLVLFVNADETVSVAEGGTVEEIGKRNFESGKGKTYFPIFD